MTIEKKQQINKLSHQSVVKLPSKKTEKKKHHNKQKKKEED